MDFISVVQRLVGVPGRARVVAQVRVVVHTTGKASPTTSDNHWSIYLILQGNADSPQESVRANMTSDLPHLTGKLVWRSHSFIRPSSALAHWDFETAPVLAKGISRPIQVNDIAALIYTKGRHKYIMSGGGSGCRFWVLTILRDLAQNNYISLPENGLKDIEDCLQYQYHTDREPRKINWIEGTFLE
ncbi:hypothetical protein EMPG_13609 [Blastomyces silverae]|uniref:DUF7770 domain-containing protein n=1 Tax=Blastomyces silverae TaxID=2060906 RepID=A0A0H1BHU9_9EURO|nr:hypothetical protein EMPG_13609 [Blastomyces silverae]